VEERERLADDIQLRTGYIMVPGSRIKLQYRTGWQTKLHYKVKAGRKKRRKKIRPGLEDSTGVYGKV
jgi:hypothetical protein